MRLFAAVVPSHTVLDHLAEALDGVAADHADGLTWALAEAWHVTLAFYGEVGDTRVEDLCRRLGVAARRRDPFELRLRGSGRFGHAVLWAGVTGDTATLGRLAASASAVGRRIGVGHDEARRYRPHLTLARSSRPADLRPVVASLAGYEGPSWTATELAVVRSYLGQGPGGRAHYESLVQLPFRAGETGG